MADGNDAHVPADSEPDAPVETNVEAEQSPEVGTQELSAPAGAAEVTVPTQEEASSEPAPSPEPESSAEPEVPPAPPEEPSEPERLTAVSLGLLPEQFVSAVSTQLHFYAPEIAVLPARPDDDVESDREQQSGGSSRRRGRRRGGGGQNDKSDGDDESPRSSGRKRAVEVVTEPQRIKGSTRLEAKKQRRRDGREAGRRRAVVTEAEFLARREAVDRVMVVRSKNGRIQIAGGRRPRRALCGPQSGLVSHRERLSRSRAERASQHGGRVRRHRPGTKRRALFR